MKLAGAAVAAAAIILAAAPGAQASSRMESVFQDDPSLITGSDQKVENTMATLAGLGVDRVRVSVLWRSLAPATRSPTRPRFGGGGEADPAAYPAPAWNTYDRIVDAARRYGLSTYFTITGPAPLWATANTARRQRQANPNASDFRAFVTAVGRRYSGSYRDEDIVTPPAPQPGNDNGSGGLGGLFGGNQPQQPAGPTRTPGPILPRVSFWSIYNEPNQPGWLRPQARRVGRSVVPDSPRIYRSLQDAGYAALRATGHGRDTILLAETAPRGSKHLGRVTPMRPLLFIRELYCLKRNYRPYTGRAAKVRGCPTTRAGRRRFVSQHPGLFNSSAWAHHPYALEVPPHVADRTRDQVTIASLPRLTRTLDHVFRRYGKRRRLGVWLTEYGYQSDPPDPFTGFPYRTQAAYINQGEDIGFRNRRIRSTSQFLLVDDKPDTSVPRRDPRYWGSTFQTGLVTLGGKRKPAFIAYQRPIDVTPARARRGRRLRIWGGLRSAPNGRRLGADLQFKRKGGRRWIKLRRVSTRSLRGYVTTRVRVRGRLAHTGYYRLVWSNPRGGRALSSRAAYVPLAKKRR